jgi:quinol monooxygenase YgiN
MIGMVTVIAKLKVKAGAEATFRQAADKMIAHVQANEPGTLTYLLHRSTADPTEFVFFEVYADQGAFGAHGSSEPMQQFFGAIGGLLDGRPEISMYEELGGKR